MSDGQCMLVVFGARLGASVIFFVRVADPYSQTRMISDGRGNQFNDECACEIRDRYRKNSVEIAGSLLLRKFDSATG